jgi:hypothetical protein
MALSPFVYLDFVISLLRRLPPKPGNAAQQHVQAEVGRRFAPAAPTVVVLQEQALRLIGGDPAQQSWQASQPNELIPASSA